MNDQILVFVSSKMNELAEERQAVRECLNNLDYGELKIRPWLYEYDAPASNNSIQRVYLESLRDAKLYIGLFWNEYGEWTIDEFQHATNNGIARHLYVKDIDRHMRDERTDEFLNKVSDVEFGLAPSWFRTTEELVTQVKASVNAWIKGSLVGTHQSLNTIVITEPSSVPERPNELFGRQHEIKQITGRLGQLSRVLIQGFAGSGKTAIAAEVAHSWLLGGKSRILWISVGYQTTAQICESIARALGQQMIDAMSINLQELLSASEVSMLVLDNVWNGRTLYEISTRISKNIALIATSQQRFPLDVIIELSDLDLPDAVQLLSSHSGTAYSSNSDAESLCRLLGCLPFSIEIAGRILKVRKLYPAQLIKEIGDTPHSLETPLGFSATGRASFVELLEVSLNSISSVAREVLLSIGALFVPRITRDLLYVLYFRNHVSVAFEPEQLEQLMASAPKDMTGKEIWHLAQIVNLLDMYGKTSEQGESSDFVAAISELVDHGLLVPIADETTNVSSFKMHDLAFSYARTRADFEARHRAVDACNMYISTLEHSVERAYAPITSEVDNLIGAANWSLNEHRYFVAESLLWSLARNSLLNTTGYTSELIRTIETGIRLSTDSGQLHFRVGFLEQLAFLNRTHLRNHSEAKKIYQYLFEIAEYLGDEELKLKSMFYLGSIHLELSEYEIAEGFCYRSLALAYRLGNIAMQGLVYGNLGGSYADKGETGRALEYSQQALVINYIQDKKHPLGIDLLNLGYTYYQMNRYSHALLLLEKALVIFEHLDDAMNQIKVLWSIANVNREQGDTSLSEIIQERAKDLAKGRGLEYLVENLETDIL